MANFQFYLGTHKPNWLWDPRCARVRLFVSNRAMQRYRKYKPAVCRWALDSGGFSELSMFGAWKTTPEEYVSHVRRYISEVGNMDWAAIQDWMCEPIMLQKTGLTIIEHQRRSVESFLRLRDLAPEIPWAPVIQGWHVDDYLRCVDLYDASGVQLEKCGTVGVGSVCRRQATNDARRILKALFWGRRFRLHGFGFKIFGLEKSGALLSSADSLAWSFTARRRPALPGCTTHKNCANCLTFALDWHDRIVSSPMRIH